MADNPTRPRPPAARPSTQTRPAPAPAPPPANSRPVQSRPNSAQRQASQDAAQAAPPVTSTPTGGAQENRNAAGQRITRKSPPANEVFLTTPSTADAGVASIRDRQEQVREERRRRADEQDVVPAEEAMRDAESVAPFVSVAAPNPRPRPGMTSTLRERIGVPDVQAPAAASPQRIKVQATQMGYYEHARRRAGDVFFIHSAEAFSDTWMRKVADDTPVRTTTMTQALRQEQDAIKAMRRNEPFAPRTNQAVRDQFQAEQNQAPPSGEGIDEVLDEDLPADQDVL